MKWLAITILILAQQPAKAPEVQGTAKANRTQGTAAAKHNGNNQALSVQSASAPTTAPIATVSQGSPTTANDDSRTGDQQTAEENRATQRKLTWFTGILAAVGVLQLVVMFLTWLVYKRQAREMRRSRHEMRRQRHVMFGQYKAMRDQIAQMEEAGKQTEELIRQASTQSGLMALSGTHTEQLAQQAVKQSSLTQRQLDLANRPWICLDSIAAASDLVFKDSGEAVIFFNYKLRNVGHSVAQHLQPWIEPIIVGIHDPREVKDRISTQLKKPVDSSFDHGKLIFPSQIIVDSYPVLIRKEIVENAIKNSPFKGEGDKPMPCLSLELFVCFDYQSTLDATVHHQTQNMCILTHPGPSGLAMGTFYPTQKVYKVSEIKVGYKGYGAYAD
jgi:hypothetical protein